MATPPKPRIASVDDPMILAAVRGYCYGVGFELALACDFRIASKTAEFALPELRLGMIPGSGGSARLVQMIGIGRAKEIAMRARPVKAQEAAAWGIVSERHDDHALDEAVAWLVAALVKFSPLAQRSTELSERILQEIMTLVEVPL